MPFVRFGGATKQSKRSERVLFDFSAKLAGVFDVLIHVAFISFVRCGLYIVFCNGLIRFVILMPFNAEHCAQLHQRDMWTHVAN